MIHPIFQPRKKSALCLMARWTLKCKNCSFPFTHSQIDDSSASSFFLPEKPDFAVGGSEFECPNCGHQATYQRTDLMYQA